MSHDAFLPRDRDEEIERLTRVEVKTDIAGSIWKIPVAVGAKVAADDVLVVLESMKTEIPVAAPTAGTVQQIHVKESDLVQEGDTVVTLEV
jgi:urea carboxylase